MNLEHISVEATIKEPVRKLSAWAIISNLSKFPQYSRNIDKIIVSGRCSMEQMSEWDVTFDGAPLSWIEKDILDNENFTMNFRAISGDFDHFSGTLFVEDCSEGGITLGYTLAYTIGIPIIEELFGPVFREKMHSNFDSMVQGLAQELRKSRVDDRIARRYKIGVNEKVAFDDQGFEVKIENISRKGLMFTSATEYDLPYEITLCGITLRVQAMLHEQFENKHRIIFKESIDEARLETLVRDLQSRYVTSIGSLKSMEPVEAVYS
jgi:ribosome-associated toxin RatA of RatAB toxin-antitoxin module